MAHVGGSEASSAGGGGAVVDGAGGAAAGGAAAMEWDLDVDAFLDDVRAGTGSRV